MRVIDRESWPPRETFKLYSGLRFPHVDTCGQLDFTELGANRARAGASPRVALVYSFTKVTTGLRAGTLPPTLPAALPSATTTAP
ncbi:MAG: hypothetical protein K0U98_00195 [Deltaproteobacteria bacterium]|nr:hypothetical protein [Deltaproteobacteria bacterium]